MEKYNYTRVSDFIRDAVLDKRLTQRQVVEIEPYKIDNNRLIGAAWRQNRVADPVYGGEEAGGDVM